MRKFSSHVTAALQQARQECSPLVMVIILLLLIGFGVLNWPVGGMTRLALPSIPTTIDEVAFFNALINMHVKHNPFAFSFYNYGWLFFLSNYVLALPWILFKNWDAVIFTTRMWTACFAVGTWAVVFSAARRHLKKTLWALGYSALLLLIPGFWKNANWFHPDWMMTFFVVLGSGALLQDKGRRSQAYTWVVISLGVAVAIKVQALSIAFPLILFYESLLPAIPWLIRLQRGILSCGKIIGIFIILNPQLLVPVGFKLFWRVLHENLSSNATNHGVGNVVSLSQKFSEVIFPLYTAPLFLALAGLALMLWLWRMRQSQQRQPESAGVGALILTFLLNLAYLLWGVNKAWFPYYLPIFALLVLVLPFLKSSGPLFDTSIRSRCYAGMLVIGLILQTSLWGDKGIDAARLASPRALVQQDTRLLNQDRLELENYFQHNNPNNQRIGVMPYIGFDWPERQLMPQNIILLMPPIAASRLNNLDVVIQRTGLEARGVMTPEAQQVIDAQFRLAQSFPTLIVYQRVIKPQVVHTK